jgi:hypothetical protein
MSVDGLSAIKQLLFANFTKVGSHASAQPKNPAASVHTSFAAMLGHARKVLPGAHGNGATPNLLEDVMAAADPKKAENAQVALADLNTGSAGMAKTDPKGAAMVALEGALMTKFVDQMLPKSNHALYGSGTAGDTWRGFEVDQFGAALAKSDPLNLVPGQGGIKLAASTGVANLFGGGLDEQQPAQPITPFST